jgi:hypothetical protein
MVPHSRPGSKSSTMKEFTMMKTLLLTNFPLHDTMLVSRPIIHRPAAILFPCVTLGSTMYLGRHPHPYFSLTCTVFLVWLSGVVGVGAQDRSIVDAHGKGSRPGKTSSGETDGSGDQLERWNENMGKSREINIRCRGTHASLSKI